MASKKTKPSRAPQQNLVAFPLLNGLEKRVSTLERDTEALGSEVHGLRDKLASLTDTVTGMQAIVKQVDDRTLRGEKLLMEVQGEQRKMMKVLSRIADKVAPAPPDAEDIE